jgi:putative transcriptional regulator
MPKTRFRSDASEAIHSAASGPHRAKPIDKKTMREYDDLCIKKAPEFDPQEIAQIREGVKVSQGVFALI